MESLPAIADLCRRSLSDPPDESELAAVLFAPDRPAVVEGDPLVGVVASGVEGGEGYVKLLCVDSANRRKGHGRALLLLAEESARAAGAQTMTVGADAPYFLWPGVEVTETGMLCLLESRHYQRVEANYNMAIDLSRLPELQALAEETIELPGARKEGDGIRAEVSAWMDRNWPFWKAEVLRSLGKGTLVLSRGEDGIRSFCAYDVNRKGTLGPVASRTDLLAKGAGRSALLAALHQMHRAGYDEAEVLWVGPIIPYARIGGRVTRVFFVYRKDL